MNQRNARERILDASLKLFASKGFEITTIKDIAALAGVNEVTIFRLFGSKGELFSEVYKVFAPTHLTPEKYKDHLVGDLKKDLATLASNYIEQCLKNQDYIRMTFFEALHNKDMAPTIAKIPERLSSFLESYLEGLYSKGEISKFNFKMAAKIFYDILFQFVLTSGSQFRSEASNESIKELVEACVTLFSSALELSEE